MVMKILHFLCKYGFRGHHKCCCGSEKNLGIATDTSSRTKELISKGLEKQ